MIIQLEKLTVRYGDFIALDNFHLAFEGGAMGLLGPNGAGKSTLLRTILGLVKPSKGSGRVLGHDIAQGLAIRQRIGYMPERECYLPEMSAVRSLQYLAELSGLPFVEARKRAHEVAHFVGLGEERYRQVESYSTGMKQKFKFAQAIVHNPQLLFLDEPTNGLDPASHRQMLDLIRYITQQRKIHIIVSTHLLPDVEATCDQVTVIENGKMRLQGPIEKLRGEGEGIYHVQLSGDVSRFPTAAQKYGLHVHQKTNGELLVTTQNRLDTAPIFRAAQEAQAIITDMRESRRSLQDVFLESLQGEKEKKSANL